MSIHTVLFDLDGTLSDSEAGILSCLASAFHENGIAPLDEKAGRELLGPPFYESLPPLVGTDRVASVIASYRQHYTTGKFVTSLYAGVRDLLDTVRDAGIQLAIATSKPEPQAVPVVEYLGISEYFATVCGDTTDAARPTKAAVVAEALRRLGSPDASAVLMVGDRCHDVAGAAAHGISCLGAGWGYGHPGELRDAGASEVFDHPDELRVALPRLLAGVRR